MKIDIVHMREHEPADNADYIEGQRAVRLLDAENSIRGELVWRLASRWSATAEIKEMAIYNTMDRRKGLGTMLWEAGLADMKSYITGLNLGYRLWRVYLLCEERNQEGRGFYDASGFLVDAILKDFYGPDESAVLYSRVIS